MNFQKIVLIIVLSVFFNCSSVQVKKMKIEYVGRAAENAGMHVWGSSPMQDKDGKTHLFAAQWSTKTQPKNFSGWFKDCEIGHYIGDSPEGPFEYVGVYS